MFCSIPRFVKQVARGNRCFVCGADPKHVPFNDEHVLPDWLLRMFALHSQRVALPNLASYRYGEYKVPCCGPCNRIMGERIEEPVRRVVAGGMDAVRQHLATEGPVLLYTWLSLLFFKTHLRDRSFREHLDARKGTGKIGDWYEWEELHHVHCVARSFHTQASWGDGVLGSLVALQARTATGEGPFDYADLYAARTVMVRMNDICLIAVMNDSGAALQYVGPRILARIDAPPMGIQLREIMANFALVNMKLKNRPTFRTLVHESGAVRLIAEFPGDGPKIARITRKDRGLVLYGAMQPDVDRLRDRNGKGLKTRLMNGSITFLFNNEGQFIKDSYVPLVPPKDA